VNLERIEALLQAVHQANVGEMCVEGDGWRVSIRKGPGGPSIPNPPPAHTGEPISAPERQPALRRLIRAGQVGIFRNSASALTTGDRVEAGQIVGGIESMGILNPVSASEAGEIVAVGVADGQGVQYGQELFELNPEPGGPAPVVEEEGFDVAQ
jgi:biotin carboxyl carrier protein